MLSNQKKSLNLRRIYLIRFSNARAVAWRCVLLEEELRPSLGGQDSDVPSKLSIVPHHDIHGNRCGAKASSYFDVEDMNDPRAVSRLERLEREKHEKDLLGDEVNICLCINQCLISP